MKDFPISSSYKSPLLIQMEEDLINLFGLILDGRGDTEEADKIREKLDEALAVAYPNEEAYIDRLAEQLNTLL